MASLYASFQYVTIQYIGHTLYLSQVECTDDKVGRLLHVQQSDPEVTIHLLLVVFLRPVQLALPL